MNMRTYKIKATPNLKFAIALVLLLFLSAGFLSGFLTARWTSPAQGITPAPSQTPQEPSLLCVRASWIALLTYPIKMKWKLSQRCSMGKLVVSHPTWKKAACVWCVLNRVNDPRFPDTILKVLEAPYRSRIQRVPRCLRKCGGRVVSQKTCRHTRGGASFLLNIFFFTGGDLGRNNHFVKEWGSENRWDWSLASPYEVTT